MFQWHYQDHKKGFFLYLREIEKVHYALFHPELVEGSTPCFYFFDSLPLDIWYTL